MEINKIYEFDPKFDFIDSNWGDTIQEVVAKNLDKVLETSSYNAEDFSTTPARLYKEHRLSYELLNQNIKIIYTFNANLKLNGGNIEYTINNIPYYDVFNDIAVNIINTIKSYFETKYGKYDTTDQWITQGRNLTNDELKKLYENRELDAIRDGFLQKWYRWNNDKIVIYINSIPQIGTYNIRLFFISPNIII